MLRLTPFKYLQPSTVAEAWQLKHEYGQAAVYMGGGTDLLVNIKHRLVAPAYVIGLRTIEAMSGIREDADGSITIGGNVTVWSIEHSSLVRNRHEALSIACGSISTPQVRRMATIAGNICLDVRCNYYNQSEHWRKSIGYCMKKEGHICRVAPGSDRCWAFSSADSVPVLIALGAEAKIRTASSHEWFRVASLYQDDGLAPFTTGPTDLITEIRIPPAGRMRTIYSKLRIRMAFDFPLVGAATGIVLSSDGKVERARIVLTAVGPHPIEAVAAEQALVGERLTLDQIRLAGQYVYRLAKPMDNTEGSISHRKHMARVFVERALCELGGLTRRSA